MAGGLQHPPPNSKGDGGGGGGLGRSVAAAAAAASSTPSSSAAAARKHAWRVAIAACLCAALVSCFRGAGITTPPPHVAAALRPSSSSSSSSTATIPRPLSLSSTDGGGASSLSSSSSSILLKTPQQQQRQQPPQHRMRHRDTVVDMVLTPGFRCLAQDDATWAARVVRLNQFQRAHVQDIGTVPTQGADVVAQVTLREEEEEDAASLARSQAVPVVFIQQHGIKKIANSYADMAIETACRFNSDVHIVLVRNVTAEDEHATGDVNTSSSLGKEEEQPTTWDPPSCAKRHLLTLNGTRFAGDIATQRLNDRMADLTSRYVHRSSNGASFETFCIARWFILEAFADNLDDKDWVFYADCDVLVFADVTMEQQQRMPAHCLAHINLKVARGAVPSIGAFSGHSTYWHRSKLEALSQFMVDAYNPAMPYASQLMGNWTKHLAMSMKRHGRLRGGVSDMWLLGMFAKTFAKTDWRGRDDDGDDAQDKNGDICFTDHMVYDHFRGYNDSDLVQDELGLPYRLVVSSLSLAGGGGGGGDGGAGDGEDTEASASAAAPSELLIPMRTLHFQGSSKDVLLACAAAAAAADAAAAYAADATSDSA